MGHLKGATRRRNLCRQRLSLHQCPVLVREPGHPHQLCQGTGLVHFQLPFQAASRLQASQGRSKLNLFYSTPTCYAEAAKKAEQNWPIKTDDFFPYASDPHSYWAGYFTSRPALKGYIPFTSNFLQAQPVLYHYEEGREGEGIGQACKQLDALARLGPEEESDLDVLSAQFSLQPFEGR